MSSIQITVVDAALNDFAVANLAVDPASVQAGGSTTVSFDQTYAGNSVTTLDPKYDIHLSSNTTWGDADDVTLENYIYSSLNKDNTSNPKSVGVTIPLATTSGSWYILVMADSYENFDESDEILFYILTMVT